MTFSRRQTRVLVLRADDVALEEGPERSANRRYKNPRLEIQLRDLSALPLDCIRVAMLYVGVCGTDLHVLQSDPGYRLRSEFGAGPFPR